MNRATLFYIDEQWLHDGDRPFGVRYDAAILPSGSVVAGFLKCERGHIQEVLSTPCTNESQEQHWLECLEEARRVIQK
jgi:hypothetical protein